MLTHPTLDQLKTLKLDGMAEAFAEMDGQDGNAALSHAEWLGPIIDREAASRETKRFESRMRTARLRHVGARARGRGLIGQTRAGQSSVPKSPHRQMDTR